MHYIFEFSFSKCDILTQINIKGIMNRGIYYNKIKEPVKTDFKRQELLSKSKIH